MTDSEVNPLVLNQDDPGSDVEIQALFEEERALRAKVDAVCAMKVQKLRAREASHQAKLAKLKEEAERKLHGEQQVERFEKLLGFLHDHETTQFTKRLTGDPTFLAALQAIVQQDHDIEHLIALSQPLMGWLVGDGAQWKAIATQLLAGNVDTPADESTETSDTNANIEEPTITDGHPAIEEDAGDTIVVNSNAGTHDTDMKDADGHDGSTEQVKKALVKEEKEESTEPMQPPLKRIKLTVTEKDSEAAPITPSHPLKTSTISSANPSSASKQSTLQFLKAGTATSSVSSPASKVSTPTKQKSDAKTPVSNKGPSALTNFERGLAEAHARGQSVTSKINCQDCGEYPKQAKLTPCEHIYCDKCIIAIRKSAVKDEEEAVCVACTKVLRRCHAVPKETIDGWIKEFAGDDEVSE